MAASHKAPLTRMQVRRRQVLQRRIALSLLCGMFLSAGCAAFIVPQSEPASAMTPFDSSSAITRSALTESSDQTATVSRSYTREPLSQRETNTGDWGSAETVDTEHLSLIQADNPTVKSLINGRDYNQTPQGFNPNHETGDNGNTYPYGQCTWWAYKRRSELGLPTGSRFGNAKDWTVNATKLGYWVDGTPRVGDVIVFQPGQLGADATYGHVGVVEKVHDNGSITISESNVQGQVGPFSRDISKKDLKGLSFIHY